MLQPGTLVIGKISGNSIIEQWHAISNNVEF